MKYFLIISLLFLSGCALTRDNISLNYDPMLDVTKIPEAEKISVQVAMTDNRTIKDSVSRKKNGYGIPMARIVSKKDVSELIKEALSKELINRGFQLISHGSPIVLVDVELTKFYNNFLYRVLWAHGISEAKLSIRVQNADGAVTFSKSVIGNGENRYVMFLSGSNAKIALERALKHAIEQVVEDPEFAIALLKADYAHL